MKKLFLISLVLLIGTFFISCGSTSKALEMTGHLIAPDRNNPYQGSFLYDFSGSRPQYLINIEGVTGTFYHYEQTPPLKTYKWVDQKDQSYRDQSTRQMIYGRVIERRGNDFYLCDVLLVDDNYVNSNPRLLRFSGDTISINGFSRAFKRVTK